PRSSRFATRTARSSSPEMGRPRHGSRRRLFSLSAVPETQSADQGHQASGIRATRRRSWDGPTSARSSSRCDRLLLPWTSRNPTGSDDGVPYVVSELIAGESLRSVIDRGPIPRATALDLALQLARGVAAAHAQG